MCGVFKLIEIRFARTSYGVVFSRVIEHRKKGLGLVGETLGASNRRLFLHRALFWDRIRTANSGNISQRDCLEVIVAMTAECP